MTRKRYLLADPTESINQVLNADWRPESGDLSMRDLRDIAALPIGGVLTLGGGAAPFYYVRRTR